MCTRKKGILIYSVDYSVNNLLNTPKDFGFQGCLFPTEPGLMEMLSDKIRIKPSSNKVAEFPERHVSFYRSYAFFVKKNLEKPLFQRFLRWLLKKESIDESLIEDVQIKVLPFKKENGNSLAGKWNGCGSIFIFPKSLEFYRKLTEKRGSKIARSFVKVRARATLIHEILHAKYSNYEEKVRRLTERYLYIYARNPKTGAVESVVFDILFMQWKLKNIRQQHLKSPLLLTKARAT